MFIGRRKESQKSFSGNRLRETSPKVEILSEQQPQFSESQKYFLAGEERCNSQKDAIVGEKNLESSPKSSATDQAVTN